MTKITDPKVIAAVWRAMGEKSEVPSALTVTVPKADQPAPFCACGCGGQTGGGTWRPGHDAKHHSALLALAKDGNAKAIAELGDRGWSLPKPKAEKPAKADKAVAATSESDSRGDARAAAADAA